MYYYYSYFEMRKCNRRIKLSAQGYSASLQFKHFGFYDQYIDHYAKNVFQEIKVILEIGAE